MASLNDRPFAAGDWLRHRGLAPGAWREVFNRDAREFGGDGIGNAGAAIASDSDGAVAPAIPANGAILLRRE